MRTELGLQSIKQLVKEINLVAAIGFMRSNSGMKLVKDMQVGMKNRRTFCRKGKSGYLKYFLNDIRHIIQYAAA